MALMNVLTAPTTVTVALTVLGVVLANIVYPWLEKLVGKTPSKTDDEFLAATEKIVNDALAAKQAANTNTTSNTAS